MAVVLVVLALAGVSLLWSRLKTQPQAQKRALISELVYCNSNNLKPCIVSFSMDADGNMLVNLLTPAASYSDFYLTISNASVENRYECQPVDDFPTHIYCTGSEMYPGETLQFTLFSTEDDTVLAEGAFAIIGVLLPNPEEEITETPTATGILKATESPTPFLLEILTPVAATATPTPTTPAYPNPTFYP